MSHSFQFTNFFQTENNLIIQYMFLHICFYTQHVNTSNGFPNLIISITYRDIIYQLTNKHENLRIGHVRSISPATVAFTTWLTL